jgi:hypothetical protein
VTRLDLARVLVQKGLLVEARALARSVAELPVSPTETAKSQLARTDAAALAAELDRRVPTVELVIVAPSSDPSATPSVTLDGAALSASALAAPLAVDPGEHLLSVRLGDAVVDARVAVAEGDHKTVTLTLPQPAAPSRPDPPPPQVDPPPPPLLPPATPAPDPRVPAGVGAQPGFVAQGLGGPATRADETAGDPLAPTAAVLLGLGLSSLVAGAISGGLALSQATGLLAECVASACPPSQADALTTHQATATAATALFAIGGVVTAAGGVVLVIYVTSDDDAKPEAGGPRVSLGWAGTGLELRGAW